MSASFCPKLEKPSRLFAALAVFATALGAVAALGAAEPAQGFAPASSSLPSESVRSAQPAAQASVSTAALEAEMPVKVILFPLREAVLSSNVPAKVLEYKFKEGESFAANEAVVHLDDRSYLQACQKAKALLAEADSALKFAERNLERNRELFKNNAIGFQEVEQSQLDRDTAESKRMYAAAALEQSKLDLDSCFIKVPYSGRVTKKSVKENEYVGVGQPVVEVMDDSKLLAVMHMPSERLKSLKIGDQLSIKVDETGSVSKGVVYEITGRINYESRTFELKAIVDNSDRKLAAGMSGVLVDGKDPGSL